MFWQPGHALPAAFLCSAGTGAEAAASVLEVLQTMAAVAVHRCTAPFALQALAPVLNPGEHACGACSCESKHFCMQARQQVHLKSATGRHHNHASRYVQAREHLQP